MIKEIVKNEKDLSIPCTILSKSEKDLAKQIITDLIDTANSYKDTEVGCVGLAANQIGYNKRICIINKKDGNWLVMINPIIVKASKGTFDSEEGCLSLEGVRIAKRHEIVMIMYHEENMKRIYKMVMKGGTAVIAQHEIDHLNGIVI